MAGSSSHVAALKELAQASLLVGREAVGALEFIEELFGRALGRVEIEGSEVERDEILVVVQANGRLTQRIEGAGLVEYHQVRDDHPGRGRVLFRPPAPALGGRHASG